ncbi:MAG: DUF2804 domain-containing protein [Pseudomonadales bacterium]
MKQHEVKQSIPLLAVDGTLTEPGWARQPYWHYERKQIKAPWYRRKEWDYYYVICDKTNVAVAITISDLGYAGLSAICWIDLNSGKTYQVDGLKPLTRAKIGLAEDTGDAEVDLQLPNLTIHYQVSGQERRLKFASSKLQVEGEVGIEGELTFTQTPGSDSMNIATSWQEKPTAFYYNHKINNLEVAGIVRVGTREVVFQRGSCWGGLDWGRGHWTYENRWYWSSANATLDGKPFGFNLGYGFTDRSVASENMFFYDGRAHKLEDVLFHFDTGDYMKPWQITSSNGRFEATFQPIVDRASQTDLLIIKSEQHQVFGYFTGKAILDDGSVLDFEKVKGFAEDVYNKF